jgi:hypothetical protein
VRRAVLVLALAATGACIGDIDPPWQLDHDRIVAVRADPPAIAAGQSSTLDALLGKKGGMTTVATPELAQVVSPASLSDVLTISAGHWVVTAPDEARLAAVRSELQLAAGAPVPLQIGVAYTGPDPDQPLVATKTIELGQAAGNPALAQMGLMIDGKPPGDEPAELVVAKLVKVPLSIEADDTVFDVTWLTSCGTMHDFDLPTAYLKVETDDPQSGELAVVVRDSHGGVAWRLWSIRAE